MLKSKMEQLFFGNIKDIAIRTIVKYIGLATGRILRKHTIRLSILSNAIAIGWYNNGMKRCENFQKRTFTNRRQFRRFFLFANTIKHYNQYNEMENLRSQV